jgi:hypothetical protein
LSFYEKFWKKSVLKRTMATIYEGCASMSLKKIILFAIKKDLKTRHLWVTLMHGCLCR